MGNQPISEEPDDAKDLAARHWFGYGRWDAPYWFVGMEPGGTDEHSSYEAWLALDPAMRGLVDCRAHHLSLEHPGWQKWHTGESPPIQTTWGPLIRTMLAFEAKSDNDTDVARYQRNDWGASGGDTAVVELSALHAPNLSVRVRRTLYRSERIVDIRRHLDEKERGFAVFYGVSYRREYERIAGPFNADGWTWHGSTLCVLVVHPAYRFAPGEEFWIELGHWMKAAVGAGPDGSVPPRPQAPSLVGKSSRERRLLKSAPGLEGDEFPIACDGIDLGRVLYDGWNVRVERRCPRGGYELIGFYERSRRHQLERKLREIGSIFADWASIKSAHPELIRAVWRAAKFVPEFDAPAGAIRSGCAVLEDDGVEVARIFKALPDQAIWIERPRR